MDQLLFTPAALLSLLVQIDELKDKEIGLTENLDGTIQLTVGQSTYQINDNTSVEFEVDSEVIEELDDLNEDTYLDMQDVADVDMDFVTELDEDSTAVQGGILSEFFKTLAVGGMIRLTAKMLSPKEQKLFDKYAAENMSHADYEKARKSNVYEFKRR